MLGLSSSTQSQASPSASASPGSLPGKDPGVEPGAEAGHLHPPSRLGHLLGPGTYASGAALGLTLLLDRGQHKWLWDHLGARAATHASRAAERPGALGGAARLSPEQSSGGGTGPPSGPAWKETPAAGLC